MRPCPHRRSLLWLAMLAPMAGPTAAQAAQPTAAGFDLITATEAAQDRAAPPPPASRAMPHPAAPRIELLAPSLGKPMASPIDIRLRWEGVEGAAVDPASVRVKYGRLGLDVTDRVLGAAKVNAQGIEAPGAKLPAGEHRLAIEVADSQRRVARREFIVEVLN
ncbi:hypothetical protein [Aquabacterium sp. OR-4]|uniref:hypothetical protein n=1 Tax=Aquabacterium sp. OR-4 TaxID=2978127 RepID=UPI0021B2BE05|nr:hypothetical protein [Aquabacterium sp. OR-4]MDT7835663.1 hypothetical protein [Aquabacterium sp. OR-4]